MYKYGYIHSFSGFTTLVSNCSLPLAANNRSLTKAVSNCNLTLYVFRFNYFLDPLWEQRQRCAFYQQQLLTKRTRQFHSLFDIGNEKLCCNPFERFLCQCYQGRRHTSLVCWIYLSGIKTHIDVFDIRIIILSKDIHCFLMYLFATSDSVMCDTFILYSIYTYCTIYLVQNISFYC